VARLTPSTVASSEISLIVDPCGVPAQKIAYRIRSVARFFPVLRRHSSGKDLAIRLTRFGEGDAF